MAALHGDRYTEAECVAEFAQLFPKGFASPEVLAEIAPEGWDKSPLLAVFHPSLEQVYEETVRIHRNIESLPWRKPDARPAPEPTREEIAQTFTPTPVEPEQEVRELVGRCLWDVFSDNHEVIAADGRVLDLGSFRASGGFIADLLNQETGDRRYDYYDYMDFYMGTIWAAGRADLTPVYELIFRRLKARGLDWAYHFPRLYLAGLRPALEGMRDTDEPEWSRYSPSEAFAREQEQAERDREIAEIREKLDEAHREAVEEAPHQPPPKTVLAYQTVYGRLPRGWPPTVERPR